MSETTKKRADWQADLATKAWQNPEFKQQLMANPSAVLAKETGMVIPKGVTIHVLEEDLNNMYFVLPKDPARSQALSSDQLDKVSGGDGVQWPPCTPGASSPCTSCIGTW